MSTPHNNAKLGDFAKTVIMPGDPYRSEYIAKKFLSDAKLVNDVRGIKGYTGYYNGKQVSVMAHGMGMPSMAIYAHELYNFYGVENIIRVGSCGAVSEKLQLRDIVLAKPSVTGSNISRFFETKDPNYSYPSSLLVDKVLETAKEENKTIHQGGVLCSDLFYEEKEECKLWKEKGVIATEMETFILYLIAEKFNKNAVALLTVADFLFEKVDELTAEERQNSFDEMIEIALKTAIKL